MSSQALQALAKANEIRLTNVEIRRKVKSMPQEVGRHWAAEMVEEQPDTVGHMTVEQLLRSIEQVGPHTAAAWAAVADVQLKARLRRLPVKGRIELARVLRGES